MVRDGQPCSGPSLARCIPCGDEQYGRARSTALAIGLRASRPLIGRARVTAVSQFVADRLAPLESVIGGPVGVLHSYVPDGIPELAAATQPLPLPDGDVVLFVGALSRDKGLDVLLAAVRRLSRPARLVVIGTRQVDTPDLGDAVVFTDVPHAQVVATMARATVVVAPSVWPDPLPMTVTEAQLAGAALVASAVGGIPEQVDPGRSAVLVPPGDVDALARAIDDLLADPARRAALGAAGRTWARRFTAAEGLDAVEQALLDRMSDNDFAAATPGLTPRRTS